MAILEIETLPFGAVVEECKQTYIVSAPPWASVLFCFVSTRATFTVVDIAVCRTTWNLATKQPPDNLLSWIPFDQNYPDSNNYDIFVIGSQETSYDARDEYKSKV